MSVITADQWARCALALKGAYPGRLNDDLSIPTWYRMVTRRGYSARVVGAATERVLLVPSDHPPSLPRFLEACAAVRRELEPPPRAIEQTGLIPMPTSIREAFAKIGQPDG